MTIDYVITQHECLSIHDGELVIIFIFFFFPLFKYYLSNLNKYNIVDHGYRLRPPSQNGVSPSGWETLF